MQLIGGYFLLLRHLQYYDSLIPLETSRGGGGGGGGGVSRNRKDCDLHNGNSQDSVCGNVVEVC